MIELRNVSKIYSQNNKILDNINLCIGNSGMIAITGKNGCGKTTLLNIIGGVDTCTNGSIYIDNHKLEHQNIDDYRKNYVSFIFQDYNLLDNMTLMDNIALPLALGRKRTMEIENKVQHMADIFGLKDHLNKYPYELSGGQKQRGAAARALITNPKIIFADEPTGALDSRSSSDLLECLSRVNKEEKATIIMVTHDALTASYSNEVYMINDGNIKCKLQKGDSRKVFYGKIIDMLAAIGGNV